MKSKGEKTVLTATDYRQWIGELKARYRATQIKAAIAVNSALIDFYWNLGKDISEKYPGEVYGGKFFEKLSADLQQALPGVRGFSKVNLIYCRQFFELYGGMEIVPQLVEQLIQIPWGHHCTLIDKCKGDREKENPLQKRQSLLPSRQRRPSRWSQKIAEERWCEMRMRSEMHAVGRLKSISGPV